MPILWSKSRSFCLLAFLVNLSCTSKGENTATLALVVTGLSSDLTISVQDSNKLITNDGRHEVKLDRSRNNDYVVSIKTQPTGQTCTLEHDTGNLSESVLVDVIVTCTGGSAGSSTTTTSNNFTINGSLFLTTDGSYWQDGQVKRFTFPSSYTSAQGISGAHVESDIYVFAALDNNSGNGAQAGFWKNDIWNFFDLASGTTYSFTKNFAFDGIDMYVTGQSGNTEGYWKNGSWNDMQLPNITNLTNTPVTRGIGVIDGSVYVTGWGLIIINGPTRSETSLSGYWKDNNWTDLTVNDDSSLNTRCDDLAVIGDDFYISGTYVSADKIYLGYWKNGNWTEAYSYAFTGTVDFRQVETGHVVAVGSDIYYIFRVPVSTPQALPDLNSKMKPAFSKNGSAAVLLDLPPNGSTCEVFSVASIGSDVVMSGNCNVTANSSTTTPTGYWKISDSSPSFTKLETQVGSVNNGGYVIPK